jgi:hypothetical protein
MRRSQELITLGLSKPSYLERGVSSNLTAIISFATLSRGPRGFLLPTSRVLSHFLLHTTDSDLPIQAPRLIFGSRGFSNENALIH